METFPLRFTIHRTFDEHGLLRKLSLCDATDIDASTTVYTREWPGLFKKEWYSKSRPSQEEHIVAHQMDQDAILCALSQPNFAPFQSLGNKTYSYRDMIFTINDRYKKSRTLA